jgi:hypothetical protein
LDNLETVRRAGGRVFVSNGDSDTRSMSAAGRQLQKHARRWHLVKVCVLASAHTIFQ